MPPSPTPPPLAGMATLMEDALEARLPEVETYEAYYRGEQKLDLATSKYRETFGRLLEASSDNWCQLVVDASVERLKVQGFRFGPRDQPADTEAWDIWQANYLDADSALAHAEASKTGWAYLLVLPGADPDTPRITVEHPAQCITYSDPSDRRARLAGFKRWPRGDGSTAAALYTTEAFYLLSRRSNSGSRDWTTEATLPNPIGVVPMVPMLNMPTLLGGGISDLEVILSKQDAINKLLADMLVNSEFVAYPQRWASGLEIPTDPSTGRPLDREAFLSSVSRLWVAEDPSVKFGELSGSDGLGYVRQMEALVQHIAAQTRTPPHYLLGQSGAFPSGESLKATETGLVAKVRRKQVSYGEAWEEALRLSFAYRGDVGRAQAVDVETIWADPEARSEGELVDALLKMRQLGVPITELWRRWGASPQEVARWAQLINLPLREDVGNPLTEPPAPPSAPPGLPAPSEPPPSQEE
jgi:hypothetical protein